MTKNIYPAIKKLVLQELFVLIKKAPQTRFAGFSDTLSEDFNRLTLP